ncbi:SIS domain-containing protein [bacterium]|nr:SIS domain-containing protein [bacterium]
MSYSEYLNDFTSLLQQIDSQEVENLVNAIRDAYDNDQFIFICGNGGSGANASHICEDLGKGTLSDFENQKRMKVLSLTDNTPYILAWANDTAYERIFVEQLKNFAEPGALLISISGSGNSPNVLRAVEWANENGLKTFSLTGYDGGKLKEISQQVMHVPSFNMGAVESVHQVVFHYVLDSLREQFKVAS